MPRISLGKVFAILFLFENLNTNTKHVLSNAKDKNDLISSNIVMSLKWLLLVCSEENNNCYSQILSNSSLSELTGKDCNFGVY